MCREYEINLIFNVQEYRKMKNVDIVLHILGYDPETETTRCMWRDRVGDWIGLVYLKRNYSDVELSEVGEFKTAKWKRMSHDKGSHKTSYGKVTKELIAKVEEAIRNNPEIAGVYSAEALETHIEIEFTELREMQIRKIAKYLAAKFKKEYDEERHKEQKEKGTQQQYGSYAVSSEPILLATWNSVSSVSAASYSD